MTTTTVRDWYRQRIEYLEAQNAKLVDELLAARRECAPSALSPSAVPASVAAGDDERTVLPVEVADALKQRSFTPDLGRTLGAWAMQQLAVGVEPGVVAREILNGGGDGR